MKVATTKSLQRDYALPFATAEIILREQLALARRHYRRRFLLSYIGLALALAGAFAINQPFSHSSLNFVFALTCLCIGIEELLLRRHAQPAIHAAARAASARVG